MAKHLGYKVNKKILLIGALPPPMHGSNVFFKYFLESDLREEYKLIFLDISDKREDLSNLGKLDFLNIYYGFKNVYQLIYKLFKEKPSIVYLCPSQTLGYLRDGLFIITTKLFSKAKCVEHLHGANFMDFFNRSNTFIKNYIKFTQNLVSYAIVLGERVKFNFKNWIPVERIFVVPNGILDEFEGFERKSRDEINILFLSNFYQFKGFLTAVEAFGVLSEKYSNVKLTIAGNKGDDYFCNMSEEDIEIKYKELVDKYKIQDKVINYGPVYGNEKIELYKKADLFLYPTMIDGFPYVILEAMSASLPVISSKNVGVIEEVVIDNETGMLTEKQNITEIVKSLICLIQNKEYRLKLGKNSRERYVKEYTYSKSISNINKVIQQII